MEMCGIAGIVSFSGKPVYAAEIGSMCSAMIHRGPDDDGYCIDRQVALGMRRLSIIDLETGHQPVHNEDSSIFVVLNGEIYNYKSLRREMESLGHIFYTETDTETLAHLYEEYGKNFVMKLRGMFAFALWDKKRQLLLLGRDRLGIKPLYYTSSGGRFMFASEVKSLLQLPEIKRTFNWQSVNHYFAALSTPASESIIDGVHKLEPGCILSIASNGSQHLQRYWEVEFEPDRRHGESYFAERLRDLLEESVALHLVSDVPVGAFLSGGMDSSSVVALMARLNSNSIKTFSVGFRESTYDESSYARLVADQFGTEHYELILQPDIESLAQDLSWYMDEPLGDSSAIPTYMVSKLAAEQVKVVLSGDGGDELFAGYDKYQVERRERRYELVPAGIRRLLGAVGDRLPEGTKGRNFLRHAALSGQDRYLDATMLFRRDQKMHLFSPEVRELILDGHPLRDEYEFLAASKEDWLSAAQHLDLKSYLPLDILTKVDRMSMANSLEARVPLLDHKLVEFAATIPPEYRLRGNESKSIFKRAMRGILPDQVIDRRKQGFAAPFNIWFNTHLGDFVRQILLSETASRRGILEPGYIRFLLKLHEGGRDLSMQLWTLLSFELWCLNFMDGPRPGLSRDRSNDRYPILDRQRVINLEAHP